jgi:hypothetical protein
MSLEVKVAVVPPAKPDFQITLNWEAAQALRFLTACLSAGDFWRENQRFDLSSTTTEKQVSDVCYKLYCPLDAQIKSYAKTGAGEQPS